MSDIVYRAYEKYLAYDNEEKTRAYLKGKDTLVSDRPNIWSSNIGKCPRQAILRTQGVNGSDEAFSTKSLDYMKAGVISEDLSIEAMSHFYGDRVESQFVLKYKMLSGKPDFVIDHNTDNPIVIEHKHTSSKFFDNDNKSTIPRHEHIGQAMSYCYMYEKLYDITPTVILFYKSWGNFAEFVLTREDDTVRVESNINGVLDVFVRKYNVYEDIESLMKWYDTGKTPPRLEKKWKGCEWMGKKSCRFYDHCWE